MHRNQQPTTPGCHRDKLGTNTMAKYKITYKCGHEEEMQLFGKSDDRQRRIAYYKTIDCPHCQAEQALKEDAAYGLLPLQGTDKQIVRASEIRRGALKNIEDVLPLISRPDLAEAARKIILAQDNALFWSTYGYYFTAGKQGILDLINKMYKPLFVDNKATEGDTEDGQISEGSLVPLTGSDKQIAWAADIRRSVIRKINEVRELLGNPYVLTNTAKRLFANDSSRYWIDQDQDFRRGLHRLLEYVGENYKDLYKLPKAETDNNTTTDPENA